MPCNTGTLTEFRTCFFPKLRPVTAPPTKRRTDACRPRLTKSHAYRGKFRRLILPANTTFLFVLTGRDLKVLGKSLHQETRPPEQKWMQTRDGEITEANLTGTAPPVLLFSVRSLTLLRSSYEKFTTSRLLQQRPYSVEWKSLQW
jgi:hypothetical protein